MLKKIREPKWGYIFVLILGWALLTGQTPKPDQAAPVRINADRMELDNISKHVVFEGNVEATRDDVVINSDKMEVYNNQKEKKIEKILASGRVRIKQGKRLAKGEEAVYYTQEAKIILTGHPEVIEEDNHVAGDEITILIQENRSIVKGSVKVVFYPQEKKELLPKTVGKSNK